MFPTPSSGGAPEATVAVYEIVTYDVPDDRLRGKIAALLFAYGLRRLQKSVFIGELSRNRTEMLALELEDLIASQPADVRIFPLCERCLAGHIVVSMLNDTSEEEVVVA